ncbi:MAG: NUDIX domain-containing protein [Candidatus Ryanbacteria bacterium]|nr:NUDIX domain-containing protein [Candidatus Ryanbacteria bacterium]
MSRPSFKPEPGQIDYTDIKRAPVINCVVECGGEILIVKRSPDMKYYPSAWNGISGFLDDDKKIEDKVREELSEELGIQKENIVSIKEGKVFEVDEPQYKKTWIVHPVRIVVRDKKIKLDWEAEDHRWVKPDDAMKLKCIPGFADVLEALYSKT